MLCLTFLFSPPCDKIRWSRTPSPCHDNSDGDECHVENATVMPENNEIKFSLPEVPAWLVTSFGSRRCDKWITYWQTYVHENRVYVALPVAPIQTPIPEVMVSYFRRKSVWTRIMISSTGTCHHGSSSGTDVWRLRREFFHLGQNPLWKENERKRKLFFQALLSCWILLRLLLGKRVFLAFRLDRRVTFLSSAVEFGRKVVVWICASRPRFSIVPSFRSVSGFRVVSAGDGVWIGAAVDLFFFLLFFCVFLFSFFFFHFLSFSYSNLK